MLWLNNDRHLRHDQFNIKVTMLIYYYLERTSNSIIKPTSILNINSPTICAFAANDGDENIWVCFCWGKNRKMNGGEKKQ